MVIWKMIKKAIELEVLFHNFDIFSKKKLPYLISLTIRVHCIKIFGEIIKLLSLFYGRVILLRFRICLLFLFKIQITPESMPPTNYWHVAPAKWCEPRNFHQLMVRKPQQRHRHCAALLSIKTEFLMIGCDWWEVRWARLDTRADKWLLIRGQKLKCWYRSNVAEQATNLPRESLMGICFELWATLASSMTWCLKLENLEWRRGRLSCFPYA